MLSIGEIERRTGLSSRQIRYYEQSGLVRFQRTPGGQRRFSEEDIKTLLLIKQLLDEEGSVAEVKRRLRDQEGEHALPLHDISRAKLTSLYPVSNRAQLLRALRSIDVPKPK